MDFRQGVGSGVPIEPDTGGALLNFAAAHQCGECFGNCAQSVGHGLLVLLFLLELFPICKHVIRAVNMNAAEHMRMAINELVGDPRCDITQGEVAAFFFDNGMENDLQQQVAEFLFKRSHIVAVERIKHLVCFFQQRGAQAFVGLLRIPRAAAGSTEPMHNFKQPVNAVACTLQKPAGGNKNDGCRTVKLFRFRVIHSVQRKAINIVFSAVVHCADKNIGFIRVVLAQPKFDFARDKQVVRLFNNNGEIRSYYIEGMRRTNIITRPRRNMPAVCGGTNRGFRKARRGHETDGKSVFTRTAAQQRGKLTFNAAAEDGIADVEVFRILGFECRRKPFGNAFVQFVKIKAFAV